MDVFDKGALVSSFIVAANLNISHQQLLKSLDNTKYVLAKFRAQDKEKSAIYKLDGDALNIKDHGVALRDNLCVQ